MSLPRSINDDKWMCLQRCLLCCKYTDEEGEVGVGVLRSLRGLLSPLGSPLCSVTLAVSSGLVADASVSNSNCVVRQSSLSLVSPTARYHLVVVEQDEMSYCK